MSARWAGIARLGGLGDNLIAASVFRPLKRLGYMTEVITSAPNHAVFQNNPFIDKISLKKDGDIPGGPEWQRWFEARSREYDIFAHLSHTCEIKHALTKDMTAFWWRPEARRQICAGSYLETVHDIVGVPHDFGPLYHATDEELDRARATKKRYVGDSKCLVWVIAGSRPDKGYSYAGLAIHRIIKELNIPVMMVGIGPKQFQMAEQVQLAVKLSNSTDKGLWLALSPDGADPGGIDHWGIRRSLAQALVADCVVTPDTGIAWAVAMEQMPKIVLLSHASQENITKHWVNTNTLHADPVRVPCWPCHRLHDDMTTCVPNKEDGKSAACMGDIGVETVVQAVKRAFMPEDNVVSLRSAA